MLKVALQRCGPVEDAQVLRTADGLSRGCGFVTFADVAAARMAVHEGFARVDDKPCTVRVYTLPGEQRPADAPGGASATVAEAREEVRAFLNRHEAGANAAAALSRVDPMTAVRTIRFLEAAPGFVFKDSILFAELQKVSQHQLTPDLERRLSDWVRGLELEAEPRQRVEDMLRGQRPEEIEHVLNEGIRRILPSRRDPVAWLFSQIREFKRRQTQEDIRNFCVACGFDTIDGEVAWLLAELTPDRARRLMQHWRPCVAGRTLQQQRDEFVVLLHQARKQQRAWKEERIAQEASVVANHAKIMAEWSDSEGEGEAHGEALGDLGPERNPEEVPMAGEAAERGDSSAASAACAMDADWAFMVDDGGGAAEPKAARGAGSIGAEHFAMHTASVTRGSAGGSTQESLTAARRQRWRPKPTHFVLCVDTSGSMTNVDCRDSSGGLVSRLQAVLETCRDFIPGSMENAGDRYSFVSFNEESRLHFSCLRGFDAQEELSNIKPEGRQQTLYSMGIRGVEAAIRRDPDKMPVRVIFLSDGDPTDPEKYLADLHTLRRKHPGDALKIYTIGFGESGKVNAVEGDFTYLQQIASIGSGHFQRSGASLESLRGAFTATSTAISRSRSASRRSSERHTAFCGPNSAGRDPAAAAPEAGGAAKVDVQGGAPAFGTIEEDPAEADEVSSDDEPECTGGEEEVGVSSKTKKIDFELPMPANIFKNVEDQKLWTQFQAAKTSFSFDGRTFTRRAAVHNVHMRRKPFMQGGMRVVYGMCLEDGAQMMWHGASVHEMEEYMMCGKRLFEDLSRDSGFQVHAAFCKSTAVATYFAKQFRKDVRRYDPRRIRLGFIPCDLYSPVALEEHHGYHFCGERLLKGHFVKLNSNAGFVNDIEYGEHSAVAQAFSHYTFDRSRGELLVVDLQGVCTGEGGYLDFLLTDPQVHSRGAHERFGKGDLQEQGVRHFFMGHRCNELCRRLRLRKEYDLCDPTNVVKMPGAQLVIAKLLGERHFFSNLRTRCRASAIVVPREAYNEWVDIKVWASRKGGAKVEELLQKRLDDIYREIRDKEAVPSHFRASVSEWEQQLQAWCTKSGASVIPWPPTWRDVDAEAGGVEELWVFPGDMGAPTQTYALQRIRETLSKPRSAGAGAGAGGGDARASGADAGPTPAAEGPPTAERRASAVAVQSWKKYQDHRGRLYWWRDPDGLWFYEDDPKWSRFADAKNAQRKWWWNSETGEWFFEPDA